MHHHNSEIQNALVSKQRALLSWKVVKRYKLSTSYFEGNQDCDSVWKSDLLYSSMDFNGFSVFSIVLVLIEKTHFILKTVFDCISKQLKVKLIFDMAQYHHVINISLVFTIVNGDYLGLLQGHPISMFWLEFAFP